MEHEANPQPSPKQPTAGNAAPKPRERGLERIDVRPVMHRLSRRVGKPWPATLTMIYGLDGMRFEAKRAAYLRCLGENVAMSEDVLPDAPFFVDADGCLARREQVANVPVSRQTVLSAETEAFLGGRAIGILGKTLVWFVRTGRTYQVPNGVDTETGEPVFKEAHYLRQDRPLNKKEALIFGAITKDEREAIIAMAPAFSPASAN